MYLFNKLVSFINVAKCQCNIVGKGQTIATKKPDSSRVWFFNQSVLAQRFELSVAQSFLVIIIIRYLLFIAIKAYLMCVLQPSSGSAVDCAVERRDWTRAAVTVLMTAWHQETAAPTTNMSAMVTYRGGLVRPRHTHFVYSGILAFAENISSSGYFLQKLSLQ